MSDGRFERAREVFHEVADAPPRLREKLLRERCGDDEELRARVIRLLSQASVETAELGAGVESAGAAAAAASDVSSSIDDAPRSIGPYRILRQIGEGGFGVVYLAEQRTPVVRQVALKVIKLGMDTKQVVARFDAERQALALMDHPGIARVLDGGATEHGRPYFVMELVRGAPINEYCDRNNLGVEQRLELFIRVCDALQHAHQKGIIHRDLKPSNILVAEVDATPMPKIIDFGIAKAMNHRLTEKTMFTELRQLIGTPEYMSPEQAEPYGIDLDTRTDIYSLGVLLYELLTGLKPFDPRRLQQAAVDEIQRIIREEEPKKPSTRLSDLLAERSGGARGGDRNVLDTSRSSEGITRIESIAKHRRTDPAALPRQLRGDLDWIVMKTLEKDRARRYDSASSLARDIERHLRNEPVTASPPSRAYRLRKFARRHRAAVSMAGAVAAAIVVGLGFAAWGFREASIERNDALDAWREAETQRKLAGAEMVRAEEARDEAMAVTKFLTDMLEAVEPGEQGRDVTVMQVLQEASQSIPQRFPDAPLVEASVHHTIGNAFMALGAFDRAEAHLSAAYGTRQELLGDEHRDTLDSLNGLSMTLLQAGRIAEAAPLMQRAVATSKTIHGETHERTLGLYNNLAVVLLNLGRNDDAETVLTDTLALQREHLSPDHEYTLKTMGTLANLYAGLGNTPKALDLFTELLASQRRVYGDDHPDTLMTEHNLAGQHMALRRFDEAEAGYLALLPRRERVLGAEHYNTIATVFNLGLLYQMQGRFDEAQPLYERAVAAGEQTLGAAHPRTAHFQGTLGELLIARGRADEGLAMMDASHAAVLEALGPTHPDTLRSRNDYIASLRKLGRDDEANALAIEQIDLLIAAAESPDATAETLNIAAWELLEFEPASPENTRRALVFAQRCNDLSEHSEPYYLDTLALAEFRNGIIDKAIATQQRAIELTPESDANRAVMEEHLAMYVAARGSDS